MNWSRPFKEPPSLSTIRSLNIVVAVFCGILALVSGPSWIAMIDAFISGLMLSAASNMSTIIKMQKNVKEMSAIVDSLSKINTSLVHTLMHREQVSSPPLGPDEHPTIN